MSTPSLLHIGGAKTASTSLQRGLFGHTPTLRYFGEIGDGSTTAEEESVVRSLLEDDDAFYASTAANALFSRYLQETGNGTFVFSSADILLASHPAQIAKRLRTVIPDPVNVLLVVREQRDALASFYSGHGAWLKPAPRRYYRRFVAFRDWLDYLWVEPGLRTLRAFSYWAQIRPFIHIFGLENVQVLPFEKLVRGDVSTWAKLGALIQVNGEVALQRFRAYHERSRITERQVQFGRLLGWAPPIGSAPDVRAMSGPLGRLLQRGNDFEPIWPSESWAFLGEFYGTGNFALSETFGLSLSELGYPLLANTED